ncbi:MAG TPA: hypothetical protein VMV77_09065 [Bacteroidales bacterium]|nr:hypothetical protein [Bacteroidales bacterium]
MSKDPAFLFYPNDYIGGTMGMTFEEKGAYIELLMTQFNRGHMSGQVIGQVVGQIWVKIQDKFKIDDKGLYYNERLEIEINKRKAFVQSRFNNLTGVNQYTKKEGHKGGHMSDHMENENRNEDVIKRRRRSPFKIPKIEEVKKYFEDNGYKPEVGEDKWHYYNDANWFDSFGNPVLNWKQKMRSVWFKTENKIDNTKVVSEWGKKGFDLSNVK